MAIVLRIVLGLAVTVVGAWMVFKSDVMLEWFGTVDWAEDKLGYGQSGLFYKLFGVLVAVLGVFIVTNIISDILTGLVSIFVRT